MTRTVKLEAGGFVRVTENQWRRPCQIGFKAPGAERYDFAELSPIDVNRIMGALASTDAAREGRKRKAASRFSGGTAERGE